jgi:hypothetical protein
MAGSPPAGSLAALDGMRQSTACVVGYGELIADAMAHGEVPDGAWVQALAFNAGQLLDAFSHLERLLLAPTPRLERPASYAAEQAGRADGS